MCILASRECIVFPFCSFVEFQVGEWRGHNIYHWKQASILISVLSASRQLNCYSHVSGGILSSWFSPD